MYWKVEDSRRREPARHLLAFVAAICACTQAPAAFAQPDDDAANSLEQRVVVTGSRIRRVDVETAVPVTTISFEQIRATGIHNLGDLLRALNQADALGQTTLTNNTNGGDGTQTISLRGLGSRRTLVLVNGRRWFGGSADLTQIPLALVERIEILGDGASAIYGTDAIAGVINLLLRDDYDGLEIELGAGSNFEGDGEHTSVGVTLGSTFERGGAYLAVEKLEQRPIGAGDRERSATPTQFVPDLGSIAGEFGFFVVPCSLVPAQFEPFPCFGGLQALALRPDRVVPGLAPGDRTIEDFELFDLHHSYNFAPDNYLLLPSDRLSVLAGGRYELTDAVHFHADLVVNQRKSESRLAPVPLIIGASAAPQWAFPISAANVYNPFGIDIAEAHFRMTPLGGGRRSQQDYDTYHLTAGLNGLTIVADRVFEWDVTFQRGESSRSERGTNFVNLLHLRRGLGPSFIDPVTGAPTCGTPAAPTPAHGGVTCVPLNLFNGVAGWTQPMIDYVRYTLNEHTHLGATSWTANLAGDLLELPAGPLAFAAGAEQRTETLVSTPDSLVAAGLSSTNFREGTRGEQRVDEVYIEFAAPVLSDLPGADMLEVNAALRRSRYRNTGAVGGQDVSRRFSETAAKYGIVYRPREDLSLRASRGDAFRAPSVSDLFSGGGESFGGALDFCAAFAGVPGLGYPALTPEQQQNCHEHGVPVGGAPPGSTRFLIGGNPELDPEIGTANSVGLVYSPGWAPGFDISIDRWEVDLDDALGFRNTRSLMQGCILLGRDADCAFIERAPGTGEVVNIRTGSFNVFNVKVQGTDLNANYRLDTAYAGSFTTQWRATHVRRAEERLIDASVAGENRVGRAEGPFGPVWRWRAVITNQWQYGDYGISWTVRWLSGLVENCSGLDVYFELGLATRQLCSDPDPPPNPIGTALNRVGSVAYHDLSLSWRSRWASVLRVGLRNAFRKDPPFMVSPFANSFGQGYDVPGGFWFITYSQQL